MFYDKEYTFAKPERKRVSLSGFKGYDETKVSRNLPCDYVDCVYNFKFKNGRLVNPYGVSALEFDGEVIPQSPRDWENVSCFNDCRKRRKTKKADLCLSHDGGWSILRQATMNGSISKRRVRSAWRQLSLQRFRLAFAVRRERAQKLFRETNSSI